MNKTKKNKSYPKEFFIHDNLVSDKNTIVDEFNKYFVEIGPKLSQHNTSGMLVMLLQST